MALWQIGTSSGAGKAGPDADSVLDSTGLPERKNGRVVCGQHSNQINMSFFEIVLHEYYYEKVVVALFFS